jgi:hypothetical protein
MKARIFSDGPAAPKVDLIRDFDALLTLVAEIIHVDHEYWGILLTKEHDIGPVRYRFTRNLVQYNYPLTIKETKPYPETISVRNKCALAVTDAEAINSGNIA